MLLGRVQGDLFDLGRICRFPDETRPGVASRQRCAGRASANRRDDGDLDPLRSFVLPGGTPTAACLHLARTVCRAKRMIVSALASSGNEPVSAQAVSYINRLSDFLFVAARYANGKGASDVLWVPGQNG